MSRNRQNNLIYSLLIQFAGYHLRGYDKKERGYLNFVPHRVKMPLVIKINRTRTAQQRLTAPLIRLNERD